MILRYINSIFTFTGCVCIANAADDSDVFAYTSQGGSPTVDSIDDEDDFANVRDALTLMGTVKLSICRIRFSVNTSLHEFQWRLFTLIPVPCLTFGVGRLLHLPSAEAISIRPNAQPRCNQKVTVIGYKAETSAVKPNKSPAIWDW